MTTKNKSDSLKNLSRMPYRKSYFLVKKEKDEPVITSIYGQRCLLEYPTLDMALRYGKEWENDLEIKLRIEVLEKEEDDFPPAKNWECRYCNKIKKRDEFRKINNNWFCKDCINNEIELISNNKEMVKEMKK